MVIVWDSVEKACAFQPYRNILFATNIYSAPSLLYGITE